MNKRFVTFILIFTLLLCSSCSSNTTPAVTSEPMSAEAVHSLANDVMSKRVEDAVSYREALTRKREEVAADKENRSILSYSEDTHLSAAMNAARALEEYLSSSSVGITSTSMYTSPSGETTTEKYYLGRDLEKGTYFGCVDTNGAQIARVVTAAGTAFELSSEDKTYRYISPNLDLWADWKTGGFINLLAESDLECLKSYEVEMFDAKCIAYDYSADDAVVTLYVDTHNNLPIATYVVCPEFTLLEIIGYNASFMHSLMTIPADYTEKE